MVEKLCGYLIAFSFQHSYYLILSWCFTKKNNSGSFPSKFVCKTYGLNIFHKKMYGWTICRKLIFFFFVSIFIELLSKNYGKTSSYLGGSVSWDLSKKKKYRTVNINFKNLFNRRNTKFTREIKKANQHSSSIKNSYATIFNNTFHRFCLFLYIIFFFSLF